MDKMKSLFLSSLLVVVSTSGLAQNPIIQTNYTADPAPMVYNDKVYLYTTHDEDNSTWFTMNDWRLYTTSDMVNWTDHGAVLSYTDFSWAKGDAWAPQCIERDGKFYMYVPMISNINNRGAIGVAVADSPYGPFYDPLGKPLVQSEWGDIDPTVFIDDDGQAYLYWGNPNLYYVKLNEDMISYSGDIVRVPLVAESFGKREGDAQRATLYEEGPWLYKRESRWDPADRKNMDRTMHRSINVKKGYSKKEYIMDKRDMGQLLYLRRDRQDPDIILWIKSEKYGRNLPEDHGKKDWMQHQ